jgi:hypothetical protein
MVIPSYHFPVIGTDRIYDPNMAIDLTPNSINGHCEISNALIDDFFIHLLLKISK